MRVLNDKVEQMFGLYEDTIVVGIVNEKGVLNADTLGKIRRITDAILYLDGVASRDVVSFSTIDDLTAEGDVLRVGPLMESSFDRRGIERLQRTPFLQSHVS